MNLTTNNIPRWLVSALDLPPGVHESEFDYVGDDDCSERFFRYRGAWYDVHEFSRIQIRGQAFNPMCHTAEPGEPLAAWDAIQTDTFFSGIVVRLADDRVIVGRVYA